MNTCHLCNQAQNEPFRSFVDGTTTYVCIPDGADCQLYANVEAQGELKIESHGKEICTEQVDPSKHRFPLSQVLRLNLPWQAPATLLSSLSSRVSERLRRVSDFTVTITQKLGTVAATYNFKLLSPSDFEEAFTASLERRRQTGRHAQTSAIDLHIPVDPEHQCCWNCNEPHPGSPCKKCAAEQE